MFCLGLCHAVGSRRHIPSKGPQRKSVLTNLSVVYEVSHFGILSMDCLQESNKTVGVKFLWMSLRDGCIYLWLRALVWLREAGISPQGPTQVLDSWVPLLGIVCQSSFAFYFVYWSPCPNSLDLALTSCSPRLRSEKPPEIYPLSASSDVSAALALS